MIISCFGNARGVLAVGEGSWQTSPWECHAGGEGRRVGHSQPGWALQNPIPCRDPGGIHSPELPRVALGSPELKQVSWAAGQGLLAPLVPPLPAPGHGHCHPHPHQCCLQDGPPLPSAVPTFPAGSISFHRQFVSSQ